MSVSLKEKASQGCHHCFCCSHYHGIKKGCDLPECAFVPRKLLEDAEQALAELKKELQRILWEEYPRNQLKKICELLEEKE
jgi:hypothetical protein